MVSRLRRGGDTAKLKFKGLKGSQERSGGLGCLGQSRLFLLGVKGCSHSAPHGSNSETEKGLRFLNSF